MIQLRLPTDQVPQDVIDDVLLDPQGAGFTAETAWVLRPDALVRYELPNIPDELCRIGVEPTAVGINEIHFSVAWPRRRQRRCLRVRYFCPEDVYTDDIYFTGSHWAKARSRELWTTMTTLPMPEDPFVALCYLKVLPHEIRLPTHVLAVLVGGKSFSKKLGLQWEGQS